MFFGQERRLLSFRGAIADDCVLLSLSGEEELSRPYQYELRFLSPRAPEVITHYLGKDICCEIRDDQMNRLIHGILLRLKHHNSDASGHEYTATLCPALAMLDLGRNITVWQNISALDIVNTLLQKHNIHHIEMQLSGDYPAYDFCMQYRESDFNFLSRLLENEGIYYYFRHEESRHVMVLADHPSSHRSAWIKSIPFSPIASHLTGYGVGNWTSETCLTASSVRFYGYNVQQAASVSGAAQSVNPVFSVSTVDYVDNLSEMQKMYLDKRSRIQMERMETPTHQYHAQTTAWWLQLGERFTLRDHPVNNGDYIINRFHIKAINNIQDQDASVECELSTFPSGQVWRPGRMTTCPMISGVLTAIVSGPEAEEIHTDEYGRIQIRFSWQNQTVQNNDGAVWVRVSQSWAGNRYGAFFLPRVGNEVIVSFIDGDPDHPMVTGSVANGGNRAPLNLPEDKYHSGWFSRSALNGEPLHGHALHFYDKKGEEKLSLTSSNAMLLEAKETMELRAQKNLKMISENDTSLTLSNGSLSIQVEAGSSSLTSAQKCLIESSTSILFRVGSSELEMMPTGISLKGNVIAIEGTGSLTLDGAVINIG